MISDVLDHALCLQADATVAEVVPAFRGAGLEPLLLKGPALARLLYPEDPQCRTYVDADLLVGPKDWPAARQVLGDLDFVNLTIATARGERPSHAEVWQRPADGAVVDLHRSLHGLEEADLDVLWDAACAEDHWIEVAGVRLRCAGPVLSALQAVTHVAYVGMPTAKAEEDLRRALNGLDEGVWYSASRLTTAVGAPNLLASLHGHPLGSALAARLAVPALPAWSEIAAKAPAIKGFSTVDRTLRMPSTRTRVVYLRDKWFPPPTLLRQSSALARRGHMGLIAAYPTRVVICSARAVAGICVWIVLRGRFEHAKLRKKRR